jgi:hypothetical protein
LAPLVVSLRAARFFPQASEVVYEEAATRPSTSSTTTQAKRQTARFKPGILLAANLRLNRRCIPRRLRRCRRCLPAARLRILLGTTTSPPLAAAAAICGSIVATCPLATATAATTALLGLGIRRKPLRSLQDLRRFLRNELFHDLVYVHIVVELWLAEVADQLIEALVLSTDIAENWA